MVAMESPVFRLTDRQIDAWELLQKPPTNPFDLCFGGGKGGAKSFFLCVWAFLTAYQYAQHYNLQPTETPIHIGWIGRKRGTDFVRTTMQTWQREIPQAYYEIKAATDKHPRHFLIAGRIAVDFGGLDSPEAVNQFNSAEYAFIAVDQAEETTRDEVATLKASRRLKIKGETLNYLGLWTANPAPCWLKEDFIDYPKPEYRFVKALYQDNPYLPDNYVKVLEDAFSHRPDLLRAYRDGDWTGLGSIDQVILEEWLTAAERRYCTQPYVKRLVSVDPARFGDDVCTILGLENTELIDARVLPMCAEPQIVAEAGAMSVRLGDVPIVVETVGVCGVADQLGAQGRNVIEYKPAAAASDSDKYFNLRAEVWNTVGRWFCLGVWDNKQGALVTFHRPEDEQLLAIWRKIREQLLWSTYKFRGQKTLIAPKEDIKADHEGVSPDYADAYVNGIFHLPFVERYNFGAYKEHGYREVSRHERVRLHPMAMA